MKRPGTAAATLSILLTLLLSASSQSSGSWNTVRMSPSVTFADICVLPDGLHGWAVGTTGGGGSVITAVLRTTDGGARWDLLPFSGATSVTLNGVSFVDPGRGWVVGAAGVIFATTDGGSTWYQQSSGTARKLSKVSFVSATEGWIAGGWSDGSSYLVLHTTNGGITWQNQSFGTAAYSCEDVHFHDSMNGWICGMDSSINPQIHHTTNGGVSWVRQTVPAGAGPVSAIDFPTASEGWATTSSLYATPSGAILHTTNGGGTWEIQGYTYLHYNYTLDCQDTQRIAIASVQILAPQQEKIFVSSDGGSNWEEHIPPSVTYTYGIQYVGDQIWYCADFGQIVHSADNGAHWDWDYKASLWNSINWSDDTHGWVIAGLNADAQGYCFRTTDGGATWARDANAPGGKQVQFLDTSTGWMLWEGNSSSVWRTTDGGGSWNRSYVGTGSWVGGIFFASPTRGWAYGGNGTVRRTTDGGVSWSPQSISTSNYVQAGYFVSPEEGWVVGGYGGGSGFIRHTTDGGTNWLAQTPAAPDHFEAAWFTDNQHGWLSAVGGRIHRTTNGGANWQIVGSIPHTYSEAILMEDAMNGWVLGRNPTSSAPGEDGRGFIYRTTNGGSSWTLEWSAPWAKGAIQGLAMKPGGSAWACGGHDTILSSELPGGLADGVAVVPKSSLTAYPNPFLVGTSIEYAPSGPEPASLGIYDAAGRQIRILLEESGRPAGRHLLFWDGRDASGGPVPSGIYYARLRTTAGGEETRRICRLR